MKVGDLVKFRVGGNGREMIGFVMRIDKQHYGSNTAYKGSQVERGKAIRSDMDDFIGYTADGIRDRFEVADKGNLPCSVIAEITNFAVLATSREQDPP